MKVFNKTKGVGVNWIGVYALVRREVATLRRVIGQTLFTPLISALLFLFVFGFVLGRKIELIGGIPYIEFVFPGILMMNILTAAFMSSSNRLYFARFIRTIEEELVAPLSYIEIASGFIIGSLIRSLLIGAGILVIGLVFGAVALVHPFLFLMYAVAIAILFSLVGILVGLWAGGFEQLNILSTFVITPLSFLGGMFYSIELLPSAMRTFTLFNPFFYFIDGMRFAMTGFSESNLLVGAGVIAGLIVVLALIVWRLFFIGWRMRE